MGIAFLPNLAFIGNLAGTDTLIILLVVLFLFGARKNSNFWKVWKGLSEAMREFSKTEDEEEHEIMRHPRVQPAHLATHAFLYRLAWMFLILASVILLFLFWARNGS
jgi:Sec-independent protein translocase protein TatA